MHSSISRSKNERSETMSSQRYLVCLCPIIQHSRDRAIRRLNGQRRKMTAPRSACSFQESQDLAGKVNEMKRTSQSVLLISSSSFKPGDVTFTLAGCRRRRKGRFGDASIFRFWWRCRFAVWLMTRHVRYIRAYVRTYAVCITHTRVYATSMHHESHDSYTPNERTNERNPH